MVSKERTFNLSSIIPRESLVRSGSSVGPAMGLCYRGEMLVLWVAVEMAPGVNPGPATSVLEFWLTEEFRATAQIIRERLFRKSQR